MKKLFLILALATRIHAQDAQQVKILTQAICQSNTTQVNKTLQTIILTQDELTELINFAKQKTCYLKGVLEGMGYKIKDFESIFLFASLFASHECFKSKKTAIELVRIGDETMEFTVDSTPSNVYLAMGGLCFLGIIAARAIKEARQDQRLKIPLTHN